MISSREKQYSRRIVFLYRGGREKRFVDAMQGACPTEFFYGAIELKKQGYDITIKDVDYQTSSKNAGLVVKFLDLLFRYDFLPSRVYGPLLAKIWSLRHLLKNSDTVVATTPGIAFAASLVQATGASCSELVAIQLGLTDYDFSKRRILVNQWLLKKMKNIVYTSLERDMMLDLYRLPEASVMVNQFGVDDSFWRPDAYDHRGYVLAIGSDGKRDYELLLKAAEKINRPFIVVSNWDFQHDIPENVSIINGDWLKNELTDKDIRNLYLGASVVVTPLQPTNRPSGQSVTLQAMSCARPVVLSAIEGLWSKNVLRDRETVLLTTPGSSDDLVRHVNELLGNEDVCRNIGETARKAVIEYATISHWTRTLESVIGRSIQH